MKLIIFVQKIDINDDVLGFIHAWTEKLAQKLDKLYVVCLAKGEYRLPGNTKVYSLGKEKGFSKIRQLFRLQRFLLKYLPETKGIFCHMCPIYAILSFPLTKVFNKKLVFWFAHYKKSLMLDLATSLSDVLVTSTRFAFPVESPKIRVIGQGIDTEKFKRQDFKSKTDEKFKILFLGRVSPSKDLKTLLLALDILVNKKNIKNIHLNIVGEPSVMKGDREYFENIRNIAKDLNLEGFISFKDRVPNYKTPEIYNQADLFVNLSGTGHFDKTTLEAMSCETIVLGCNKSYIRMLPDYLIFPQGNAEELAQRMENIIKMPRKKREELGQTLREIIVKNHNLDNLVKRIVETF